MTRPALRKDALIELQRGEGLFDPIVAENWVSHSGALVTAQLEIVSWEAPDKTFGIIDSFTVSASHPLAYVQCLFEVARNGTRVSNIQFTQPQLGDERQTSFQLRFGENDVIALRFNRNGLAAGSGLLPKIILFGRISGRYTHERIV